MTPPPTPETIDAVIGILALYVGPIPVEARSSLRGDLALGWADRLSLANEVEQTFEIEVPDNEARDWETVEDVAGTIQHRTLQRPTARRP